MRENSSWRAGRIGRKLRAPRSASVRDDLHPARPPSRTRVRSIQKEHSLKASIPLPARPCRAGRRAAGGRRGFAKTSGYHSRGNLMGSSGSSPLTNRNDRLRDADHAAFVQTTVFGLFLKESHRLRLMLRPHGLGIVFHGVLAQRHALLDQVDDLLVDLFDLPADIVEHRHRLPPLYAEKMVNATLSTP